MRKIIHELRIHQIELQLQNEELIAARYAAEVASEKYTELYELAPTGFFTLNHQGEITGLNLSGAAMLGKGRQILINSMFGYFVSDDTRPLFNLFLSKVFNSKVKETCDIMLSSANGPPACVHLTGIVFQDEDHCIVNAVDISELNLAEEKMRLAYTHLRLLIDPGIVGVIVATADGKLIEANDYYLRLIGYSRDEFDAGIVNWRNITPAEYLHKDEIAIRELRETGKCTPYEKEYLRRDGTRVVVQITDAMLPGAEEHIVGFIVDNTERKRIENALIESERYLKETQIIAQLGTYTLDIPSGNWTSSDVLNSIFGIDPDWERSVELWESIVHPEHRKVMTDYFTQEVVGRKNRFDKEYKIIRQNDKAERWVHGIGMLKFNTDGEPVTMVGTIRDITESKLAEEALLESRKLYRDLIELAADGILVGSDEGFIIDANSHICSLSGRKREELIGMHISNSIFTPESMKEMPFQFGRLRNGEIVVSERYILGPDGFQIPIEMRTKMMPNGMYQSIIRDITERKESEKTLQLKNEELSKLNAEKDKFFSIIAHDLRSPFNAFLGLTRMMEEELSALTMDEIQKIAENMGKSANMLFLLLENLLEWARMQQGLRSYNPKPFKILSLVYKSIDLVFDSAEKKKINLGFNIPDDLIVIADEQMLESLMRNLVFNAIKFTPHGGHITIAASVKPDNSVEISIRDTGIGMNQKMIDDLFRLDAHTHRNGTDGELSTGLGLIICRDFVEKHGGKLWVESEEGKGSTF